MSEELSPETTPTPSPAAAPKKRASAKDELDFDNFSVATERATEIRTRIQELKDSGWMEELRLLVTELGVADAGSTEEGKQMELSNSAPAKAYRGSADNGLEGFSVTLEGTDILVKWQGKTLLETFALPKAGEFAFLQVAENLMEALPALRERLAADTKLARQAKHDRQAHFKGFGKAPA